MKYDFENVSRTKKVSLVSVLLIIIIGIIGQYNIHRESILYSISVVVMVIGFVDITLVLLTVISQKRSARQVGNKLFADGYTQLIDAKVLAEVNSDPINITGLRAGNKTYYYTYIINFSEHTIYYFTDRTQEVVAALVVTDQNDYYPYLKTSTQSSS